MVRLLGVMGVGLAVACGGSSGDSAPVQTATGNGGQCGAVTDHNVLIRAMVVDVSDAPVQGAEIRLVEDSWHQPERIFGSVVTGGDGVGEFTANGVVSVEDCWGVVLNYRLEAQRGDQTGADTRYNSSLFNAITNGTLEADTTSFPIVIE